MRDYISRKKETLTLQNHNNENIISRGRGNSLRNKVGGWVELDSSDPLKPLPTGLENTERIILYFLFLKCFVIRICIAFYTNVNSIGTLQVILPTFVQLSPLNKTRVLLASKWRSFHYYKRLRDSLISSRFVVALKYFPSPVGHTDELTVQKTQLIVSFVLSCTPDISISGALLACYVYRKFCTFVNTSAWIMKPHSYIYIYIK